MGKLFGTDGIRGVANETLDTKLAYRIGQAAAISLQDGTGRKPTVVIGKDTRISSDMLEAALTAGLTACGCNVVTLGVIPTPAVAYLTVQLHADAGAVISASHNPYEHNGIKLFSREGFKLSDALDFSKITSISHGPRCALAIVQSSVSKALMTFVFSRSQIREGTLFCV